MISYQSSRDEKVLLVQEDHSPGQGIQVTNPLGMKRYC